MGFLVLTVSVFLIAAPVVALKRRLRRRGHQPGSTRWRGYVSFQETRFFGDHRSGCKALAEVGFRRQTPISGPVLGGWERPVV